MAAERGEGGLSGHQIYAAIVSRMAPRINMARIKFSTGREVVRRASDVDDEPALRFDMTLTQREGAWRVK